MELDLAHEKSFWNGSYEPDVVEIVSRFDLGGKRVWDVGAHAGYFSLLFARRGAEVVAFEANPHNAARLRSNVARNAAAVSVVEAAVNAEAGVVAFKLVPGRRRAQSSISAEGNTRVKAVTLDDELDRLGMPYFVKMDIEGAELPALRAAPRLLAAKPILLVEVHRGRRQRAATAELLSEAGYTVEWVGWRILATT
jgi:FkbM family methyltransferase